MGSLNRVATGYSAPDAFLVKWSLPAARRRSGFRFVPAGAVVLAHLSLSRAFFILTAAPFYKEPLASCSYEFSQNTMRAR